MAGHQYDLVCYFYMYEIDGHRGVGHATSGPNIELCKKHILQTHPRLKILEIHKATDHAAAVAEAAAANSELAKDPMWFPWTNADVKASANAAIIANDQLPPDPATLIKP